MLSRRFATVGDAIVRTGTGSATDSRMTSPRVTKSSTESESSAYLPSRLSARSLVRAVHDCRACSLYARATQPVFGEGTKQARLMLVGEQPGDQEDRQGHPFVGPAGKLLHLMMEEAGIDRSEVYLTNAVKHFKWEPRGKRRLHSKPSALEVHACRGWLEAEIRVVRPTVIVCLGATAAQALLGSAFRVTKERGKILSGAPWAERITATFHPSAILRMPSREAAAEARKWLILDLKNAYRATEGANATPRSAKSPSSITRKSA